MDATATADAGTDTTTVLIVDDHPAVRAGLRALLESEPGLSVVAEAPDGYEMEAALRRWEPDVVVLDHQLQETSGLLLCRRLKRAVRAPRVILYSAFAAGSMALPARLAGADALLDKGVAPRELTRVIRDVAAGIDCRPAVAREELEAAGAVVRDADLPILGMLLGDASFRDVVETLGVEPSDLDARLERIIGALA